MPVSTSGRVKPRSFKNLHLIDRDTSMVLLSAHCRKDFNGSREPEIFHSSHPRSDALSHPRASSDYEKIIPVQSGKRGGEATVRGMRITV